MRNAILLDTNVLLDYYVPHRTRHVEATRLVDGCLEANYALLVAVSSLNDFFYNLQTSTKQVLRLSGKATEEEHRLFAKHYAWGCLESLLSFTTVVGMDSGDVWVGHKHRRIHDDFEDDLVIAAALRTQPDFLVTNDEGLLKHAPVAAVNVEDAIKLLEL